MTDGRTDGRTEAIAISPTLFLKKRGDNDSLNKGQSVLKTPLWHIFNQTQRNRYSDVH